MAKEAFEVAIDSYKEQKERDGKDVDPNVIKTIKYLDSLADKLPE